MHGEEQMENILSLKKAESYRLYREAVNNKQPHDIIMARMKWWLDAEEAYENEASLCPMR